MTETVAGTVAESGTVAVAMDLPLPILPVSLNLPPSLLLSLHLLGLLADSEQLR